MTVPPVVFLPGSLCDERVFTHQTAALGDRARVADFGHADTISGMAAHVVASAPPHFVAVGLSLGGIVAAHIAELAPERVAALALLDTNLDSAGPRQIADRRDWARMTRSGEFASLVSRTFVPSLTVDPVRHGALVFDMAYSIGSAGFLRQNTALMARRDLRSTLDSFAGPVLVICGADDRITPPATHAALAASSPRANLVTIDDCGHLSTVDQPAAVTETLLEWLELCNTQHIPGGVTT